LEEKEIWTNSEFTKIGDVIVRTYSDAHKVLKKLLEDGNPVITQFRGEVKVSVVTLQGVTDRFAWGYTLSEDEWNTNKIPVVIQFSDLISYDVKLTTSEVTTSRVSALEIEEV
jgi:hypothetical protein